jgi:hypothetical protein
MIGGKKVKVSIRLLLFTFFLVAICPVRSWASEANPPNRQLSTEWGGHVRGRGSVSWPDDESALGSLETGPYYDGSGEFRLKNKVFFEDWGYFETHYEAILSGGDTRRTAKSLAQLYPVQFSGPAGPPNDDLRVMGLTGRLDEDDDYILYHRLDRFSLTVKPEWGTIRIGRQVITWGNGLLFNPMDLFNPFAPTDVERDYKVGDDMVTTQFRANRIGDFQVLYVPRRDPASHDVAWDESSLAGKWHFAAGTTEFDLMGARHYQDYVLGLGSTGFLGDAAWRMDATWTFLNEESNEDGFLFLVANMDYSWGWLGRNMYGLIEFYLNGLGNDDYSEALADPDIIERLERGEIYTIGRTYLAGQVQMELHPLFNAYLGVISSLADPSGVFQPRAIWDIDQDVQVTFGGNIYYGGTGTEYGGFEIPGTSFLSTPSNSAFLWLTYFF